MAPVRACLYDQRVQRKGMNKMYAIIVTGGKQYRVEQGDIVYIEKLDVEADSEVKFDQVLAIGEEGSVKVGAAGICAGTTSSAGSWRPRARFQTGSHSFTSEREPCLRSTSASMENRRRRCNYAGGCGSN